MREATRLRLLAGFLAVAAGVLPALAASAQSRQNPDITGKWSVETQGVIIGNPPQWPQVADSQKPRLQQMHATLVIEHEEGDRFWGEYISPTHRQKLVGIFTGEDQRFLIGMERGIAQGSVSANKIRWCYVQVKTKEVTAQIAGCNDAVRE